MGKLQEFLNKNKGIEKLTKKVAISKRLSNENGEPFLFTIKGISATEYDEIRQRCMAIKSAKKMDFDITTFNVELILKATIEPNFKDAESLRQTGSVTSKDYIESVLLAGEITKLANKIQEFNGFSDDISELIEESKN